MSIRAAFVKFRGGNGFLITLTSFLAVWFSLRLVVPLDPDFGVLNVILSIEASLATCLLLDQQAKQTAADRKLLIAILKHEVRIEHDIEGEVGARHE